MFYFYLIALTFDVQINIYLTKNIHLNGYIDANSVNRNAAREDQVSRFRVKVWDRENIYFVRHFEPHFGKKNVLWIFSMFDI
jgi:hypothetical protein